MIKSIVKSVVIIQETIKAVFIITYQFFKWGLTNKLSLPFFIVGIIGIVSWSGGFLYYVNHIQQTWDQTITTPEINEKTDAIVVLTGGSERVRHALHLLNSGFSDKLFISGVNKEVRMHELFALHGYDQETEGKLKSQVKLGYAATDTISNAHEIARWAEENNIKSIRLVTSNYHIKRAVLELHSELPDVKIIPHSVIPINIRVDQWWNFPKTREVLIDEYNKYLMANVRIFLKKLGF